MASWVASLDTTLTCSYFRCLLNFELFTFMSRTMVVIMDPTGKLVLICKALWTLLRGSFNAYVRSSLCFQVIYRA
jgi:hypothetical protein